MIVLRSFKNIFLVSELRKKLLFTLGVFIVYRLGSWIPVAGVNLGLLRDYMNQSNILGGLFNYFDLLSGGALAKCTIFALGISPYITASIMMQLLSMSIPSLEQLSKDGELGRKVINQYTRYLTLGLGLFWSFVYSTVLETQGFVLTPGWGFRISFILTLAAGSIFVMWLGEQISMHGLGNGASMIIFAGIVANFPKHIMRVVNAVNEGNLNPLLAILVASLFLVAIGCIVFLEKGERKIPVQYARRVIGRKVFGGQSSYIPFKINTVGVMPVIFASTFLQFPVTILGALGNKFESLKWISAMVQPNGSLFNSLEFILIIFFTYFYTALVFNPVELADNLKKGGGFIPGIRPGKKTAEYFDFILNRIGLVGAIYLGVLAIAPNILIAITNVPIYMGGTSLLIVVGVALEASSQTESYLIEHNYEGFLTTGKVKG